MISINTINFKQWIEDNRHLLKPPVGNKVVWKDGEFIVMVVGGPNQRKDYHYNPTPEFFYQIEGDMILKIKNGDEFQEISIKEGEIYLLPSGVPHSPQRKENTVGLVIEQRRQEKDGLLWYCENCGEKLFEEYFNLSNVETQFPPIFQKFYESEDYRTCKKCGIIMEPKK